MGLPVREVIDLVSFEKADIRAGQILAISEVEGSRKLLRFTVDFGSFSREILSAIRKERESFSSLVGKQALFLINLQPKEIAGIVSNGLILDLGYSEGLRPTAFIVPEFNVPNGTRLG
ncbi:MULTISPECIES: hypothetical protein [Pseudomonas]|uniref:hypothetical protein n=1 Tax=Pseudomonas nitroreducens TaxID=46680 RepID=UPI001E3ED7DB|nr:MULTISPECIES: hypothetical protein [Pseudomonas]MCE4070701.1 hypothetical protein [Pseudomonas nitritireducens]MCE4080429.1 hypothetical protein [Pseudomonas nitroreducens]